MLKRMCGEGELRMQPANTERTLYQHVCVFTSTFVVEIHNDHLITISWKKIVPVEVTAHRCKVCLYSFTVSLKLLMCQQKQTCTVCAVKRTWFCIQWRFYLYDLEIMFDVTFCKLDQIILICSDMLSVMLMCNYVECVW